MASTSRTARASSPPTARCCCRNTNGTFSRTPPPNPLSASGRGRKNFCSPSPLRGGGWGEGLFRWAMSTHEKYLRPEVIRQVARLDLRAKFIVEGFLAGLHASPLHG